MTAILNSLNSHNFPIFQPIMMKLVSKYMVYRVLSDKKYLLSGLRSPLRAVKTFKRKSGPDRSVSDNRSSSVTLNELAMKARKSYGYFKFQQRSHTMTKINPNEV